MKYSEEVMLVTNCAGELPNMDSLLVCSGCDKMVAVGAVGHLQLQLVVEWMRMGQ